MMTTPQKAVIESLNILRTYLRTTTDYSNVRHLRKLYALLKNYERAQENFNKHNLLDWDESEEVILRASAFTINDAHIFDQPIAAASRLGDYEYIELIGTLEHLKRYVKELKKLESESILEEEQYCPSNSSPKPISVDVIKRQAKPGIMPSTLAPATPNLSISTTDLKTKAKALVSSAFYSLPDLLHIQNQNKPTAPAEVSTRIE